MTVKSNCKGSDNRLGRSTFLDKYFAYATLELTFASLVFFRLFVAIER